MATSAWLEQQLDRMNDGIVAGKTRRRKIESVLRMSVSERQLKAAVVLRGWRVAQIGLDYVFAPPGYTIRPIV
jgi:hypothetical protein